MWLIGKVVARSNPAKFQFSPRRIHTSIRPARGPPTATTPLGPPATAVIFVRRSPVLSPVQAPFSQAATGPSRIEPAATNLPTASSLSFVAEHALILPSR